MMMGVQVQVQLGTGKTTRQGRGGDVRSFPGQKYEAGQGCMETTRAG